MNTGSIQANMDFIDPESVLDEQAAYDLLPPRVRAYIGEHGSLLNLEDVFDTHVEDHNFDEDKTIAFIKDCNEVIGAAI